MKTIETKKIKIDEPLNYLTGDYKISPKPKKILGYFVGDSSEPIFNMTDAIVKWASESRPEFYILGDYAIKNNCCICGNATRGFEAGVFICTKCRKNKKTPKIKILENGSRITYHYNGDRLTYVIYRH